ncbi:unnamed protein product [Caenorhabditis brenneri]
MGSFLHFIFVILLLFLAMCSLGSCLPEQLEVEEPKYVKEKTPVEDYCPYCKKTVTTTCHKTFGILNFILFVVCLFCPFLVCCFWCRCFNDIDHRCPECEKVLGRHDAI